jgi:hypothetical protein
MLTKHTLKQVLGYKDFQVVQLNTYYIGFQMKPNECTCF